MKNLVVILALILFAPMAMAQETNDYDTLWAAVQKQEREGLTKSALKTVQTIAHKAKAENKSPEIIKALLHISKYTMILEEDAVLTIVNDFKAEISQSSFPTKNVLESYLGNLYWQFFQENRYQFYNRTQTETKIDSVDFRTWDLTTLFHEINTHFTASLQQSQELQQVKVSDFNSILHQQKGSETYRPTLFDVLAHTALLFYKTDENSITRPADKFEISDPNTLCTASDFIDFPIDTSDKTSLQSKALEIYQELLKFHKKDSSSSAFVEVDLERLQFVYQNATFTTKDTHYLATLTKMLAIYKNDAVSGLYNYQIASLYNTMGDKYTANSTDEIYQWKKQEALKICDAVISQFPNSSATKKCKDLKANILQTELHITTEKYIPINQPSKVLVSYKNLNDLNFTAYKISSKEVKNLSKIYEEAKKLDFIQSLQPIKTWQSVLKNEEDYQNHTTETIIPQLGLGELLILAQPNTNTKTFAYATIQVTNIGFIATNTDRDQIYQVVDRNTGIPLQGAKVKLSYKTDYNLPEKEQVSVTNALGMVHIPKTNQRWYDIEAAVSHADDYAVFGKYYIYDRYDNNPISKETYASFLFTDRSIYRPGQPLYFKGILIKSFGDKQVLPNTIVTISLFDVNRQKVIEKEFTTNAYGSVSGEFILPNNGLTGNYYLEINAKTVTTKNTIYFSVEEYKRPKFETSFEPVTETYKVNDTITLKGTATAFAGSTISDAKVVYTVKRLVQYPNWYYWRWPYNSSEPQEIKHGETETNAEGAYEITFKAQPDTSVSQENLPVFNYEITADVTDINGETKSTTTIVRIGYHSLTATIAVAENTDKDKKNASFTIQTNNLNGQFVPTKGVLKIYKLVAPDHVKRIRPWTAPDYKIEADQFRNLFPYETYDNNNDSSKWDHGKLVWDAKFDTGQSTEILLPNLKKWDSGKYIILATAKDKFGQTVTDKVITSLFSDSDKKLADHQLFQSKTDKESYKVGDDLKLTLLSAAKDLHITLFIEKGKKLVDTQIIRLSNGSKTISIPVTKEDLGGFSISYSFSAYNSFVSGSTPISVPYPKTDINIETVTFRNKLQPGTDETWSFKVKGPKGDKVSAEILASMYDASLDEFRNHSWNFNPVYKPHYYTTVSSNAYNNYATQNFSVYNSYSRTSEYSYPGFDTFNWFGFRIGYNPRMVAFNRSAPIGDDDAVFIRGIGTQNESDSLEEVVTAFGSQKKSAVVGAALDLERTPKELNYTSSETKKQQENEVLIRKNLQETAFFFPQLLTDEDGNVSFRFTTPEALTKWKLQLLAHTKSLESATTTLTTVTQKELMVIPNAPRFLREGDKIIFSSKIANITDKSLTGIASLQLKDAITGKDIRATLMPNSSLGEHPFTIDAKGNTQVSWELEIPENLQAVQYTVIAKTADYSDGEQNVLPVLTNRILVTETLPMWVRSNQSKKFTLDKLKNNKSTTLKNHKLTLEITSNPAWYAVQALPYLMEYPYDCSEQLFSKYYANTLATHIANDNPRIQEVFQQWANSDVLLSNLEKNAELQSILIQETPWLRDAQTETEQKKRIALLFNLNKMKSEQANALTKLQANQMHSGAWPWFKGGKENRYITQHIISGLGHLEHLNASTKAEGVTKMVEKAIAYLDKEFVAEYEQMKKHASNINDDHLSYTQMHYLYMRSFFPNLKSSKKTQEITTYYREQAQKYWLKRSLYAKGLLALSLHRMEDNKTAAKILKSLKENSITSDELGMYWKENTASWYWHQAPIETQALLIEAFAEIENNTETIDNLKIWLLKNKQTNQWKTTKATTEAVYALLLQGSDWISVTDAVDVLVGGKKIDPNNLENVKVEAATGYYKTSWNANEIAPEMAEVQLSKKGNGIAWGSLYWQYFEDLDKITSAKTPLQLKKKLFLKNNTDTGEQLVEIVNNTQLNVGDLVRVRIELRADRPMEFIHMKDMRASGLEPLQVLSQYKWQDGLGYYESTKDASTNFFFDYIPKGVYVFEYDLRVNNAGDFSAGITTIQSMYAPEFSSHSEGTRITTKK
ncbi:MG2 domain-containing protein [Cellulophaga sp. F20128]|uniref:alpha-2-macroglobulin family protein n=1 Tax=Cellulophaga sp. F20128 TaxID=2926413 RepID=UPI001FF6CBBB|nr:MG2 domain-containing protein [Cellulophaga sp. F20128]MCK0156193.1 MG2 domain-containing protein [Cellulophaga sp. F20128]